MHLARAAHRPSGALLKEFGSVIRDEKSWVPSKTATQRPHSLPHTPASSLRSMLHIRNSEKQLYSNDHDGTEPSQSHPPPLSTGSPASCRTLLRLKRQREQNDTDNTFDAAGTNTMLHTTPSHSPSWDTL